MIEMSVEKITPAKAKEYLKKNTKNPRGTNSLSRSHVNELAEIMKAGLWQLNGEAIVFDEEGFLKNGQNRLAAIIICGKPIETCVIRGIKPDVFVWDIPWRRTGTQMVNADEDIDFNCNPSIFSAAGIIVTNFKTENVNQLFTKIYIKKHEAEWDRTYRITCYGGQPSQKSKCAPCLAAAYLALQTESLPSYELELFFRIFNAKNNYPSSGHDPSPALIARRMFDERTTSGYQIQKEKLEIIVMALQDFHNDISVRENYKIQEPFYFSEWMNIVRRKDGLEK